MTLTNVFKMNNQNKLDSITLSNPFNYATDWYGKNVARWRMRFVVGHIGTKYGGLVDGFHWKMNISCDQWTSNLEARSLTEGGNLISCTSTGFRRNDIDVSCIMQLTSNTMHVLGWHKEISLSTTLNYANVRFRCPKKGNEQFRFSTACPCSSPLCTQRLFDEEPDDKGYLVTQSACTWISGSCGRRIQTYDGQLFLRIRNAYLAKNSSLGSLSMSP